LTENILYAQSGGVTSVINATACGVIKTARASTKFKKVFAAKNGILGVLNEEIIDTSRESSKVIDNLIHTPGGAFGSCRYKLRSIDDDISQYVRLVDIFKAHKIKYFLYNGGGDSQDTANKVGLLSSKLGHPISCIGIPKTIDNDLPITDSSPGFGSVAKYVATSTLEASLDVRSMAESSTKVFLFEVMGRNAGWIAASSGLIKSKSMSAPHVILFPEIQFDENKFIKKVKEAVIEWGYCVVVASEGIKRKDGSFVSDNGSIDAFGHSQLGGVAPFLADLVKRELQFKCHWAVSDYLQRSARHLASSTDVQHAFALGEAAVRFAENDQNMVMPVIRRIPGKKYRWKIESAKLSRVANVERKLPRSYITREGYGITTKAIEYLLPLIQGEEYPPYAAGLPNYAYPKNQLVTKKLPAFLG